MWACIGDLNEVLTQEEKSGGRRVSFKNNFQLKFFMDEVHGIDIGYSGRTFTWCNKRGGPTNIRERLDKVITSVDQRTTFRNVGVNHLNAYQSDHMPIVLNLFPEQPKLPRPFRFQEIWIKDPACHNIVKGAWETNFGHLRKVSIWRKIINTARALTMWNREFFWFCKEKIIFL